MQNNMPIADYKDIIEIETDSWIPIWQTFVSQTESSYISAVNWDMSTKFGFLIDNWPSVHSDFNKQETGTLVLSSRGRHFERSIGRHIYALGGPIWLKFGSFMQNIMRISAKWSKSKPEVEFQYSGRLFFPNGNNVSTVNWIISTRFGSPIDFDLLKTVTSTNTKPEVVLSCGGGHVKNWYDDNNRCRWPDLDDIWQAHAEQHANYRDVVEVETGRRISIRRTFVFPNRK